MSVKTVTKTLLKTADGRKVINGLPLSENEQRNTITTIIGVEENGITEIRFLDGTKIRPKHVAGESLEDTVNRLIGSEETNYGAAKKA